MTDYKRYCKTLRLNNDAKLIEEYKAVHAPGACWPEITQGMRDVGIIDMEIYIIGTQLFMIMDTVANFDHDSAMKVLASKPRQSEWETHVSKFQKTSADATADEKWQLMERIFKLDLEESSVQYKRSLKYRDIKLLCPKKLSIKWQLF